MGKTIKEINILLLGETGVGKSTFINAFANYLTFVSLEEAENEELIGLIATKFTVTDQNYEEQLIEFGESSNECSDVGASATQAAKSYIFPLSDGGAQVRLIDTPGIGDTRGVDQDDSNFEQLLNYIGDLKELHAICILLKPNNSRLTVMFEYCIKQLLSRLDKSASDNILFLFTNSRGTFYRPGDTLPPLRKILDEIRKRPPHADIPIGKKNIFCIDNESFRFLLALNQDIFFDEDEKKDFMISWKNSTEECWRMLLYIIGDGKNSGLIPHQVQDTISINEARRLIVQLSQPLAEIAQLIQSNIDILNRKTEELKLDCDDLKELKKKLIVPVINIRAIELSHPRTVCTALQCIEVYEVNGVKSHHYKQVCHDPCGLRGVPKEIVGSPELMNCTAMGNSRNCRICSCDYLVHMHIYYDSESYEDNIEDENVKSQIKTKTDAKLAAEKLIKDIELRREEYEEEQETILKSTAKFAHFLQNNAITPYNDAYEAYLKYLIDQEKSHGEHMDPNRVQHLQQLLRNYCAEKITLDKALKLAKESKFPKTSIVTAQNVIDCVQGLYSLKHCGPNIKDFFDKQKKSRQSEQITEREVHYTKKVKTSNRFSKLFNF